MHIHTYIHPSIHASMHPCIHASMHAHTQIYYIYIHPFAMHSWLLLVVFVGRRCFSPGASPWIVFSFRRRGSAGVSLG